MIYIAGTLSKSPLYFLASIVLLHAVLNIGLEVCQIIHSLAFAIIHRNKKEGWWFQLLGITMNIEYLQLVMNWIKLPLFILSAVFASTFAAVRLQNSSCPYNWQWQIGVVVTWLTWIGFIMLSTQFGFIGVYTLMFVQVLKTFAKLAVVAFLLMVAFGFLCLN